MTLVCIDCRYLNGRPSGIGEMVAALVNCLPAMAPDLRFRFIASPEAPGRLSDAPNVEQVVVQAAANGPGTMWWLPQVVDLHGVDLFHATFNIMPAGLAMPCVTTIHDLMWLEHPEWCDTGWQLPIRRAFFSHGIARALSQSAAIATVSEATRRAVVAARPDAAARTFAVGSGVSRDFVPQPVDPFMLAALGIDPSRRFVLTVGQAAPYKNHVGALRAFAIISATRPELDLVLVQRQNRNLQALHALTAELGLEGRIHILSVVTRVQLIQLYAAAALLLHPSLCEGFGAPLVEAMACGCPIVTSDRASMPEVTADAALLVDPCNIAAIADATSRILDDPSLADNLRCRGHQRAAALKWEDVARANLAIYRRVLAG